MFYEAFSQPEFLPQTVLMDGPTAMFRWTFKGKHTGVFNGVKPTGKPVEVTCFTTFRRGADGLVEEQYDLADMGTLLRQNRRRALAVFRHPRRRRSSLGG